MNNKSNFKKNMGFVITAILILGILAIFKIYATDNHMSPIKEDEEILKNNIKYETLFEKDSVKDIYVEISEKDWESILADPMEEEYKSVKVTIDGITLENVGFRTKGNLTLRSVANSESDRYSFRIKLDKYVEGQNILGLDEFVVNNMYADPSYMREYLSYEALREIGADVPLTTFANVYINGELFGFYLMVEAIDDSFLERNFEDNSGNLYKQEQGSTLQYVEGSDYNKSELKSGDDKTKTDLKNFIKILNEMPDGEKGDIESVLDVDSALRYIAANTVLGNYDSYNGNMAQNYYLYGQDGKFTVIPWDYNMSIGGFSGRGEQTIIPIDEPVLGVNIENLPLIDNLLEVDEYKEKYHEYIKELLDYLDNIEGRVTELANTIRPYVEADPTKFYTMEQFEGNITYSETNEDLTISEEQNGNQQNEVLPQQPPQGMPPGFENGDRPKPPQGDMGVEMKDRPGGGKGMMGNAPSILNFIKDRVENIKKQLAGELPTTGNSTMSNMSRRN